MARTFLYAGCYTNESPVGISVFDASDPGGLLVERSSTEGVDHPSFLAVHPNGRLLYAVSETTSFDGEHSGGLVAFRIDPVDGSLMMTDRVSSCGAAPCYISLDADGRHIYAANYLSGTVAVYTLTPDGGFGELVARCQHRGSGPSSRQEGPHAHCVLPGPSRGVYAVDLGADRVVRYAHHEDAFDDREQLELDAGSGPRHLAFHPEHSIAFLVCELSSTIEVLGVDPTSGALRRLGSRSTLPGGFVGDSIAAEVQVHPGGHRVYVSNRGHDSIAAFAFTSPDHPLEPLGHVDCGGRTPRNFALHPSGRVLLVANQESNTIVPFVIHTQTGLLKQLEATYEINEPVCLTFVDVVR